MDHLHFRDLVYKNAVFHGQPYLNSSQVGDLSAHIHVCLDDYCRKTSCLTSDRVT